MGRVARAPPYLAAISRWFTRKRYPQEISRNQNQLGPLWLRRYSWAGKGCMNVLLSSLEESLLLGANAIFSVVAGGSPPLAYQWHFNNAAIFGATNSSYTVTNVQAGSAGVSSVT